MTNQHPITPPPELIKQWISAFYNTPIVPGEFSIDIAIKAAQWGADQELEATLGLMATLNIRGVDYIRNARRSARAPSLKESALAALDSMSIEPCLINGIDTNALVRAKYNNIRRALEALPQ